MLHRCTQKVTSADLMSSCLLLCYFHYVLDVLQCACGTITNVCLGYVYIHMGLYYNKNTTWVQLQVGGVVDKYTYL